MRRVLVSLRGTVVTVVAVLVVAGCGPAPAAVVPHAVAQTASPANPPMAAGAAAPAPAFMLPGEAAALPALGPGVPFTGHLLIAESSAHSRVLEIDRNGAVTWVFATTSPPLARPLGAPDDAFYGIDGSSILLNSESGQGVMAVNRRSGAVLWQIGTYNRRGHDSTHFNNPDDLVPAVDGTAWMADIDNCRLLHVSAATGAIVSIVGGNGCAHDPPRRFANPNGAFPARDGSLVVTEISGSWVTRLNADGTVRWSRHVPALYPSDAMAYPDGSVLLTDYSSLGQVLRISADGAVLWRYAPRGKEQLNHPSIAIPLASNRVAISDDYGNRIVVVDPTTSAVVWEWSGAGGYRLLRPDGLAYRQS